jgi:hypothetical protein
LPFVFVSANNTEVRGENINHMQKMLIKWGVIFKAIHADKEGYYLVFDGSYEGDRHAQTCFEIFRGRNFMGKPLNMQLFFRGRGAASSSG